MIERRKKNRFKEINTTYLNTSLQFEGYLKFY